MYLMPIGLRYFLNTDAVLVISSPGWSKCWLLILALGGWVRMINSWAWFDAWREADVVWVAVGQDSDFILAGPFCWTLLPSWFLLLLELLCWLPPFTVST
ncbi:hypothetical protein Nepgr_025987 [Nepenthes gracilis]|uniref:Uncharacterized protein n=1 Tax=Nepenthes gracilis TaxID=150966 RepID=A0AAD3T7K5_NEPGR|nr:hypothetical protein Nepgr_025987 [Nepenthes gracilis]